MRLLTAIMTLVRVNLSLYWLRAGLTWPAIRGDGPLILACAALVALWIRRNL